MGKPVSPGIEEKSALKDAKALEDLKKNIKVYRNLKTKRNHSNHAALTGDDKNRNEENSFFKYMQKKGAYRRRDTIKGEDLVKEMTEYLDAFERLYEQTDRSLADRVIDLA